MNWPPKLKAAGVAVMGPNVGRFYDLDPLPIWPHTHVEQIVDTIYIVSEVRFYRDRQLYARFCLESLHMHNPVSNSIAIESLISRIEYSAGRVIESAVYSPEFDKIINHDQE